MAGDDLQIVAGQDRPVVLEFGGGGQPAETG
jgi:hypothetical protein